MKCPKLKYEDGAWFDYCLYCELTGKKVGDNNNHKFTDEVCHTSAHYECPAYKKSVRGY